MFKVELNLVFKLGPKVFNLKKCAKIQTLFEEPGSNPHPNNSTNKFLVSKPR
jgi:hypothetical protein